MNVVPSWHLSPCIQSSHPPGICICADCDQISFHFKESANLMFVKLRVKTTFECTYGSVNITSDCYRSSSAGNVVIIKSFIS